MKTARLPRALFIIAGAILLIGIVVSVATNGRQFYPAIVLAIVVGALGLILGGRR